MRRITYITNPDGWGCSEPTEDDIKSFHSFVRSVLKDAYPRVEVVVEHDPRAPEARVKTSGIDPHEVGALVQDAWESWTWGERAQE